MRFGCINNPLLMPVQVMETEQAPAPFPMDAYVGMDVFTLLAQLLELQQLWYWFRTAIYLSIHNNIQQPMAFGNEHCNAVRAISSTDNHPPRETITNNIFSAPTTLEVHHYYRNRYRFLTQTLSHPRDVPLTPVVEPSTKGHHDASTGGWTK